ncbi:right-handed parallel beta-helix repeat-containing protein [Planctomyces sp. SH-PL14]|uniref:right-handed parallel beta-helix repeat-containing protein n=1 Tax=Planctomyces sp. SH-PL14 TaxID=1632864 RepID=UPI00078BD9AC|nr:right-handed parallel beta-helix repeat-containing protein [Planctomyces sp. SH-PL14]AMV19001.1 hypothetical protein VT03_14015 [Planctomyces sp. SH-PL14]
MNGSPPRQQAPARLWTLLAGLAALLASPLPSARAETYRIGPAETRTSLAQVPWDRLLPGDIVEIVARPEPYRNKFVLCRRGTQAEPIIIRGILGPNGERPILDGENAVTPPGLNFWSEKRGVIKIGGANHPDDTMPAWITIENLEITNARHDVFFLGRDGLTEYAGNASAIYVEKGENLVFRNCRFHHCGNGFLSSHDTKSILVEGCHIHDNGVAGSILEHNSYTETEGITFQTCRFGPLVKGAGGTALKDRSAGLVVRYNWIEGGNRQLDLVDAQEGEHLRGKAEYDSAFVYGNVLVEYEGKDNNQIVHFGGDSGIPANNRQGPLWFCNNTVVSFRKEKTCLFRLSTNRQRVEAQNNIVYVEAEGRMLSILDETGDAHLQGNWFKEGWKKCHGDIQGSVTDNDTLIGKKGTEAATDPGFVNLAGLDFRLRANAAARQPRPATGLPSPHVLTIEPPTPTRPAQRRPAETVLFPGAFGSVP